MNIKTMFTLIMILTMFWSKSRNCRKFGENESLNSNGNV